MITAKVREAIRVHQRIDRREQLEAVGPDEYDLRNWMQTQHNADNQAADLVLADAELRWAS